MVFGRLLNSIRGPDVRSLSDAGLAMTPIRRSGSGGGVRIESSGTATIELRLMQEHFGKFAGCCIVLERRGSASTVSGR